MDASGLEELPHLGALADPARRALYRHVAAADHAVGRDEAAEACGIARPLAAYHLDRLADDGLLDVSFERLNGKSGPGAGRTAKLYRRSNREFQVTVPPRDYEVPARLLAAAIERAGSEGNVQHAVVEAAHAYGIDVGTAASNRVPGRARSERVRCLRGTLEARGYEPYDDGPEVRLRNCPFDALSSDHRDLVCGMNLQLLRGVLDALSGTGLEASLAPREGECCVVFRRT